MLMSAQIASGITASKVNNNPRTQPAQSWRLQPGAKGNPKAAVRCISTWSATVSSQTYTPNSATESNGRKIASKRRT